MNYARLKVQPGLLFSMLLLVLMFWGVIWGIVGMFLAVPVAAVVNILLARFEYTRPIADLLAGRFDSLAVLLRGDRQATTNSE